MLSDFPNDTELWAQGQDSVQALWLQSTGTPLTMVHGLLAGRPDP